MKKIKQMFKYILSLFTFRRFRILLLGVLIASLAGGLGFVLWWNFIFFPDDYSLTMDLAKTASQSRGFYEKRNDLLLDLKRAKLSNFSGPDERNSVLKKFRECGVLIGIDDYAGKNRTAPVYRAGTGHVGIWVDERSSMLMNPGSAAAFDVKLKSDGLVEFSGLSKGKGAKVRVSVKSRGKVISERVFDIAGYSNPYSDSDVKMKFSNRGFGKSTDSTGWTDCTLEVAGNAKSSSKFTVQVEVIEGEPLFLANLNVLEKAKQKKYNIVYIIFDGVALPYWTFHNSKSNLTPYMAEVAKSDYIVFDNMITLGNKTRISLSGLFTSMIPSETRHGINRNFIPQEERDIFYDRVNKGLIETFPSYLRKNGFVSAQFGNSGFTVNLLGTGTDYGFERSFEFQYNPYDSLGISREFFSFVRKNRNRNFYAYCHYNTPHKPFFAPLKYYFRGVLDGPLEGLWRPDFAGAISYTDDVFRNIHLMLKKNGLLENTIVVIATDHGSGYSVSRFDRGFQYDEYTKQVFMVHLPEELKAKLNAPGGHRSTYVSSINISPTLLDLAGFSPVKQFKGKSFMPVIKSLYKMPSWDDRLWCLGRKTVSLVAPDLMKYIVNGTDTKRYIAREYDFFGDGKEVPYEMLFDLRKDPEEKNNLIHSDPESLKRMREIFFKSDIHHPEKILISFASGNNTKKRIEVKVRSLSPIIRAELYDEKMNILKTLESGGKNESYSFHVEGKPVILVLEQENDRSPFEAVLYSDGKKINSNSVYGTSVDLNILKNPVKMSTLKEFRALAVKKPAVLSGWKGVKGNEISVRVARVDLHRWIDMNSFDKTKISASMRETLKSWGYIQ